MEENTTYNTKQAVNNPGKKKITTGNLVMTGMFTAVICVLSLITIPVQPIPFTLSLFAIFLTGALLPPRFAFLSALTYLLIGAFGVPVYANFTSGFQVLFGMTGGYLMAYPIMAFVTALFYKYTKKFKYPALLAGMLISLLLCYILGTIWFSLYTKNSFIISLTICVFPFVLFDLLKIALAMSLSTVLRKTAFKNSGNLFG